jgi:hypothetical protein
MSFFRHHEPSTGTTSHLVAGSCAVDVMHGLSTYEWMIIDAIVCESTVTSIRAQSHSHTQHIIGNNRESPPCSTSVRFTRCPVSDETPRSPYPPPHLLAGSSLLRSSAPRRAMATPLASGSTIKRLFPKARTKDPRQGRVMQLLVPSPQRRKRGGCPVIPPGKAERAG